MTYYDIWPGWLINFRGRMKINNSYGTGLQVLGPGSKRERSASVEKIQSYDTEYQDKNYFEEYAGNDTEEKYSDCDKNY